MTGSDVFGGIRRREDVDMKNKESILLFPPRRTLLRFSLRFSLTALRSARHTTRKVANLVTTRGKFHSVSLQPALTSILFIRSILFPGAVVFCYCYS